MEVKGAGRYRASGPAGVWDLTLWGSGSFVGDGYEWGFLLGDENVDADGSLAPGTFPFRFQMDPGKDKEGVPQPSGPPARRKFVIPLDEDEVPPGVVGQGDAGPLGGWGVLGGGRE